MKVSSGRYLFQRPFAVVHADKTLDIIVSELLGRGVKNTASESRHVARYGSEEFLVLLPEVTEEEAVSVAERIRKSVEAAAIPNPGSRVSRRVTLSIGIAVQTADEAISPEQLQCLADAALYLAKQTGRNRVHLHRPDSNWQRSIRAAP
ncbi:GGDEF domain-containing protein [Mesorhizobium sp. USDA-HM6]|nr:GGDEF domain-containing protein [Mesorhizobium sp. USDA-HM6]